MLNAQLAPDVKPAFYSVTGTGQRFLLDRSGPHALIRFDGGAEVVALRASNGPRGDEFYRTDTGHKLLRITELGNVIIYPDGVKAGMPTSLDASGDAINPPTHPASLSDELKKLEADLLGSAGVQAKFQIAENLTNYADWTLEAAQVVALGLKRSRAASRANIKYINMTSGQQAALGVSGDTLSVSISPADGYAGRPSSSAVAFVGSR
jgi:hypothetical protein